MAISSVRTCPAPVLVRWRLLCSKICAVKIKGRIDGFSTCKKQISSQLFHAPSFCRGFDVFSLIPVVLDGNQQFQKRYSSCLLVEPDIELHDDVIHANMGNHPPTPPVVAESARNEKLYVGLLLWSLRQRSPFSWSISACIHCCLLFKFKIKYAGLF